MIGVYVVQANPFDSSTLQSPEAAFLDFRGSGLPCRTRYDLVPLNLIRARLERLALAP